MSEKLEKFMVGFSAATLLLKRAGENGYFIEAVCLAASVIDGALRIGLILQHQIATKSESILNEILYQDDEDKIVSERSIYRRAFNENIIDEKLFKRLELLYKKRNKVIHRYIISDIQTVDIFKLSVEYRMAINVVSKAIYRLESQQIKLGVGMTKAGKGGGSLEDIMKFSVKKHGELK